MAGWCGDTVKLFPLILLTLSAVEASYRSSHSNVSDQRIRQRHKSRHQQQRTCPYCHVRDELRNVQIEMIKRQILEKLGMEHPPNMTGRTMPSVSKELLAMYTQQQQERTEMEQRALRDQQYLSDEGDEETSQTVGMWIFASRSTRTHVGELLYNDTIVEDVLFFDLPSSISRMKLENATLWLYRRRGGHRCVRIRIEKLVREGNNFILKEAKRITTNTSHPGEGYVRVENIMDLVRDWLKSPKTNYGIIIRSDGDGLFTTFRDSVARDADMELPVLEVYLSPDGHRRKRTTRGNFCRDSNRESACCRVPLVVDFHEFGWDWIIAPTSYHANYCSGDCPYVYLQKYPHTHLVQQRGGTAGPCCGPHKLSPIHMLFWDNHGHIRFDKLPGMVVDSCSCH